MLWRPDLVLRVILIWTSTVGAILVWLPLVRGLTQGSAYRWMLTEGIGGRGVSGDYWMLVPAAIGLITLLALGERSARWPFHVLLLAFHLPLAGAVVYAALSRPELLRFEGATVGASFSLVVVAPVVFGCFAAAAVFWVVRDIRRRRSRPAPASIWSRANRIRLVLVILLLPVQAILFHSGGIESWANRIGVGLVFWQWTMIHRALSSFRATCSTGVAR